VFLIGFAIILVNQASFVYAVKLIPPEQVEIIYYLWPIMTIVVSALFFETKKPIAPILSAFLGLAGVYILLFDDGGLYMTGLEFSDGYLFAFAAALAWVCYSLFARYNPRIPMEMNGMWCGLSALACIGIHLYFEHTVMPTLYEWALMAFIGVFILVFSLKMWAMGMRHGHFNILTVFSYMTPLISVLLLMLFEKTPFRSTILLACQLIILGGLLCTMIEWWENRKSSPEAASLNETSFSE
jgi:drug/metabolite transporter (DMT)-like permease